MKKGKGKQNYRSFLLSWLSFFTGPTPSCIFVAVSTKASRGRFPDQELPDSVALSDVPQGPVFATAALLRRLAWRVENVLLLLAGIQGDGRMRGQPDKRLTRDKLTQREPSEPGPVLAGYDSHSEAAAVAAVSRLLAVRRRLCPE